MKCDDDTFVKIDSVMMEVKKVAIGNSLYLGNINFHHKPLRNGKWSVTYEVNNALRGLCFLKGCHNWVIQIFWVFFNRNGLRKTIHPMQMALAMLYPRTLRTLLYQILKNIHYG